MPQESKNELVDGNHKLRYLFKSPILGEVGLSYCKISYCKVPRQQLKTAVFSSHVLDIQMEIFIAKAVRLPVWSSGET